MPSIKSTSYHTLSASMPSIHKTVKRHVGELGTRARAAAETPPERQEMHQAAI